jgi:hypothetical protein
MKTGIVQRFNMHATLLIFPIMNYSTLLFLIKTVKKNIYEVFPLKKKNEIKNIRRKINIKLIVRLKVRGKGKA